MCVCVRERGHGTLEHDSESDKRRENGKLFNFICQSQHFAGGECDTNCPEVSIVREWKQVKSGVHNTQHIMFSLNTHTHTYTGTLVIEFPHRLRCVSCSVFHVALHLRPVFECVMNHQMESMLYLYCRKPVAMACESFIELLASVRNYLNFFRFNFWIVIIVKHSLFMAKKFYNRRWCWCW